MDAIECIRTRRSIRGFKPDPVLVHVALSRIGEEAYTVSLSLLPANPASEYPCVTAPEYSE